MLSNIHREAGLAKGRHDGVKIIGNGELKVRLDEAGIGIPFPQMDVHLDKIA